MAAELIVGDIWRVQVFCSDLDQSSVTSFDWRVATVTGVPSDDADLAANVDSDIGVSFKGLINNDASYDYVGTRLLHSVVPSAPPIPQLSGTHSGSGTRGLPLPRQTSGVLTVNTDYAGRAFRGRKYLPFPGATDLATTGKPTAGYRASLDTLGNLYVATRTFTGAGGGVVSLVPVLWHRKPVPIPPALYTDVTAAFGRPRWGVQRRRGDYGRPNHD